MEKRSVLALLIAGLVVANADAQWARRSQTELRRTVILKPSEVMLNFESFGGEETLHYDRNNADAFGLIRGGDFHCAVRLTPRLPCSLKAILFFHGDRSHNSKAYAYAHGTDTTPGALFDSVSYSGATVGWVRADLPQPRALTPDRDFWVSVRIIHDSSYFPMGVDSGPMVYRRGGFFSLGGTIWTQLANLGLNSNANIRAIVIPSSVPNDLGVARIVRPKGLISGEAIQPVATIKNFGSQAAGPADIRMLITPGSYSSVRTLSALNTGDTTRLTFDPWTPPAGGLYTIKCTTELGSDMNPDNDAALVTALVPEFTEDFEASNAGYTVDCYPEPGWAWGAPASPRPVAHSGTKVWGAPLNGDYANQADWNLQSRLYTATVDSPVVAFHHWYRTELNGDGGNFAFSLDTGRTWRVIDPWLEHSGAYDDYVFSLGTQGYTGTRPTTWLPAVFQIPVTATTVFQLRWRFTSDNSNVGPGWVVDDVSLIGAQPTAGIAETTDARAAPLLTVWPSPAGDWTVVSYSLPQAGFCRLTMFDLTGRLVSVLEQGTRSAGTCRLSLPVRGLARGIYLLRLETTGQNAFAKLVIE